MHRLRLLTLLALLGVPALVSARVRPVVADEIALPAPLPTPTSRPFVGAGAPLHLGSQLSTLDDLPADQAQLVVWYDGDPRARPSIQFQCRANDQLYFFGISALPRSSQMAQGGVATAQIALNGCTPTGVVRVDGVVPDGVIDGVAFGLLVRDRDHRLYRLQSRASTHGTPTMVGMWPLAFDDAQFARQTPQLRSANARHHARALVSGAEYLGNGTHVFVVPEAMGAAGWPPPRPSVHMPRR